jgi:hypothetical protein
MRKLFFVLVVGLLTSGCVFGVGVHSRRGLGVGVQVSHVHGHHCGHAFVNGVWVVR